MCALGDPRMPSGAGRQFTGETIRRAARQCVLVGGRGSFAPEAVPEPHRRGTAYPANRCPGQGPGVVEVGRYQKSPEGRRRPRRVGEGQQDLFAGLTSRWITLVAVGVVEGRRALGRHSLYRRRVRFGVRRG